MPPSCAQTRSPASSRATLTWRMASQQLRRLPLQQTPAVCEGGRRHTQSRSLGSRLWRPTRLGAATGTATAAPFRSARCSRLRARGGSCSSKAAAPRPSPVAATGARSCARQCASSSFLRRWTRSVFRRPALSRLSHRARSMCDACGTQKTTVGETTRRTRWSASGAPSPAARHRPSCALATSSCTRAVSCARQGPARRLRTRHVLSWRLYSRTPSGENLLPRSTRPHLLPSVACSCSVPLLSDRPHSPCTGCASATCKAT
mmetsp:Transcript_25905/g.60457  ORF Transcript_25905/g.60457 Transcript_25905/m.60457 type:complete len:261 (+) Transcript_25905:170-952(+)